MKIYCAGWGACFGSCSSTLAPNKFTFWPSELIVAEGLLLDQKKKEKSKFGK